MNPQYGFPDTVSGWLDCGFSGLNCTPQPLGCGARLNL